MFNLMVEKILQQLGGGQNTTHAQQHNPHEALPANDVT